MKAKVQIWVDANDMTIHSIAFHDRVLESTISNIGKTRLKKFLRKRIIQMPIQVFKPFSQMSTPEKVLMMVNEEIDVYPNVTLHGKRPFKPPHPYSCDLHPAPVLGMQATSFEEYYKLQANFLATLSCREARL